MRTLETTLRFKVPYAWSVVLGYLGPRAIAGVEEADDGMYRRSFQLGRSVGVLAVSRPDKARHLDLSIAWSGPDPSEAVVTRLRQQLDLDAPPRRIANHLRRDPRLASRLKRLPGLRVVRAFDPFELTVRAIVGQQVTVTGATSIAGGIASRFGEPLPARLRHGSVQGLFPTAERLAAVDLADLPMPRARSRAIEGIAKVVADRPDFYAEVAAAPDPIAELKRLPGIGEWTAQYVAMRALGHADAFPASDLGLLRAMDSGAGRPSPGALEAIAQAWRPYRAYAAVCLWMG